LADSSAIQHFHDKLLHIKDRIKVRGRADLTPSGDPEGVGLDTLSSLFIRRRLRWENRWLNGGTRRYDVNGFFFPNIPVDLVFG
jgi:hypothetical protein